MHSFERGIFERETNKRTPLFNTGPVWLRLTYVQICNNHVVFKVESF